FIGDFVGNIDFTDNSISSGDFNISFSSDYDGGYSLKGLGLEQEGTVDKKEFSSIVMMASKSVLNVESTGSDFSFICNTDDASYSPIKLVENKLHFELKGQNKCKINIPEGVSFYSNINQGVISLKNMAQSFSITGDEATVFWSESRPEQFSLTKKVSGVSIVNAVFPKSAPYKVNIQINKGILKIKKFQIR
ncbi:MAG: hypothetical protein KAG61_09750, partial [Bacteriovoracaceae bacterium]|nr:hypothetical protein [Bacteriovoracaceae bacterium]